MSEKTNRINSKKDCYELYQKGFFGNKPITWNSIEEIVQSKWQEGICIRGIKKIGRTKVKYDLSLEEAKNYVNLLKEGGILEKDLTFNQSLPNNELTIQGEFMRSEKSYSLLYTEVKEPMNLALKKESKWVEGVTALTIIKEKFSPSSYEDLQTIFDLFPDSIIEFSTYRINLGSLPNRNTLIWEVRNY